MSISQNIKRITKDLPKDVTLVAVSKTKPHEDLLEAYSAGQRIFGENKVQEMVEKHEALPKDIQWHMIGHVQRNKVKYMAPFVSLIHGVDSFKLLKEVNKQAQKNDRCISCLIQIKIADEDSKFGMGYDDAKALITSEALSSLKNIKIVGLMGMATFTEDTTQIEKEFKNLAAFYDSLKDLESKQCDWQILSMGMSGDYKIAVSCGSNMVRIGSHIFGARNYQ